MIPVDTSVWVDHLRKAESELETILLEGRVLIHSMIIGELACGNLYRLWQRLRGWQSLPRIAELLHDDVLAVSMLQSLRHSTLGTEVNAEAWVSLYSNISLPFDKPPSDRIAVKVINHLGDEVMKVFDVN